MDTKWFWKLQCCKTQIHNSVAKGILVSRILNNGLIKKKKLFKNSEFWNLSFFRHGAHNWEGPGALTAISALFALTKLVQEHSWVPKKIDPNRVVYAGIQQYPVWYLMFFLRFSILYFSIADECLLKLKMMSYWCLGHSMGGHGAWHLATHYPDRGLGLITLAGWIKKEEYGDSNLFFR